MKQKDASKLTSIFTQIGDPDRWQNKNTTSVKMFAHKISTDLLPLHTCIYDYIYICIYIYIWRRLRQDKFRRSFHFKTSVGFFQVASLGWFHMSTGDHFWEKLLCGRRKYLHPRKLTWQWKNTIFDRRYIFKRWFFYCHVSFPGCI